MRFMKKGRIGLLLLAVIVMLNVPLRASASGIIEGTAPPEATVPTPVAPRESEFGGGESIPPVESPPVVAPEPSLAAPEPSDVVIVTAPASGSDANAPSKAGFKLDGGTITVVVCVVCAIVAVIAVLGAVLVVRRGGRSGAAHGRRRAKASGAGIPLRLEVYSGRCRNRSASLKLSDYLTIGSSPDCDIIFDDPEVAPEASCIRLVDGQIYIEDLNSLQGVALDGIRFQGRNRLRSGEVISIGSVEFAVFFSDNPESGTPT